MMINNLIIGDKKYKGTSGLWELIRNKNPTHYPENDLDTYKKSHATNECVISRKQSSITG